MAQAPATTAADPYAWLEEIEGERALAFARAENARSLPQLQDDPRYAGLYAEALKIAVASDRIPGVGFAGAGTLRDFWQDADHVRGLWRQTDLDSYRAGTPAWRVLLDLDELSEGEGANWVWKGATGLAPDERLCLVALSDGGKDAIEVREFDAAAGRFVEGGFRLPEGKQSWAWLDADALLVGREWAPGELTASGYPYVLKRLARGQTLGDATEVFRGDPKDVSVQPWVVRDADGVVQAVMAVRALDFFNSEVHLIRPDGTSAKVALPTRSNVQGYVDGRLLVSLEQDWPEKGFRQGDLIDFDLPELLARPQSPNPFLVLRPTHSQSVEQVATTRSRAVVALLDDVKGQVLSLQHGEGGWRSTRLALPADSAIGVSSASDHDDNLLLIVTSFLTPTSQWLADATGAAAPQLLRATPARFDASTHLVEQLWATSKDGTRVPYFVVRPKDLAFDGSAPTLLDAYGGFQVSLTPAYSGAVGKLWLERGGVYAVANIRGGGEFGPRWHEAALKADRMRAYEDFFAVSEDLIARKITSPRRLGIIGGSNGGLLMGVALTRRPELYRAVVIQVPLFDMIGYTRLGAGASWVGEYGDPAIPEERAWIEAYSPYQKLEAGKPYPRVFIETSTKDDRVHPAHARKAAARLKELGYDYLYWENIDGGHAAAANLNERALRQALEFTYLTQQLMD